MRLDPRPRATFFLAIHLDPQVNVLAYEYSGYGKSEGAVSEDNCYADIRAAYDYLTTQKKTPPQQIVL